MKLGNKNIKAKRIRIVFDNSTEDYWDAASEGGIEFDEAMRMITRAWEERDKPKEPLIKDEKIRKAVRAWAEANKINKCKCNDETHCITFETERGMFISFEYADPIPPEGNYTIAELCGEEEE